MSHWDDHSDDEEFDDWDYDEEEIPIEIPVMMLLLSCLFGFAGGSMAALVLRL